MSRRTIVVGALAVLLAPVAAAAPPETERPAAHAERPSKPTGPIAVDHRSPATPQVGVALTILVTARVAGAASLTLDATASRPEALLVETPVLVSAEAGRFEWALTVVPLALDAGFVNVVVSGAIDGVAQARSVAIPLRVAPEPAGRASSPAGGETLIALPVDETR